MSTRQWPTFKEPNATKVQPIPGEVETAVATDKFGTVAKDVARLICGKNCPLVQMTRIGDVRY